MMKMARVAQYLGIGVATLGLLMLVATIVRFVVWGQVEVNGFLMGFGLAWLGWMMVLIVEEGIKYR